MQILFTGRTNHEQTQEALEYCLRHFETTYALGDWGDPLPERVKNWRGDYIFNYLGRWILPADVLASAKQAAINFHPAPPEYPGFGPVNWALYDNANSYGVTCHYMNTKVDTGPIIQLDRFAVYAADTVESVLKKTYAHQLAQFYQIADYAILGCGLPYTSLKWSGVKRKRADLEELSTVDGTISDSEMHRRIRAVSYNGWGVKWRSEAE